jgi:hypothetical protein
MNETLQRVEVNKESIPVNDLKQIFNSEMFPNCEVFHRGHKYPG